jgi:hypothetical protein
MCKSDYIRFCFRVRDITPIPAALPWLTMVQFFNSTLQNADFKDGCHSPWWQCQCLGRDVSLAASERLVVEVALGQEVGCGRSMWGLVDS